MSVVEPFLKRVCLSIMELDRNVNPIININECLDINKLIINVDSIIKKIVNEQVCSNIMSTNCVNSTNTQIVNNYSIQQTSMNIRYSDYDNYWKQIIFN
jgi:hypothetical protein